MDRERFKTEAMALAANLKERAKKHQHTMALYDSLKQKQQLAHTQLAAQSAVNEHVDDIHWDRPNDHASNMYARDQDDSSGPRFPRQSNGFSQGLNGHMQPPSRQGGQGA